jgi:hypothetical protein
MRHRTLAALAALAGLGLGSLTLSGITSAAGNPPSTECAGYDYGLKLDNLPDDPETSYTYPGTPVPPATWETWSADGSAFPSFTATISLTDAVVSFTSDPAINLLVVKAGSASNAEEFLDGALSGSVDVPINPNNGTPFGVSHVTLCFNMDDGEEGNPSIAVIKTAVGTYDQYYTWSIDKELTGDQYAQPFGGSATIGYYVSVVRNGPFAVAGSYEVTGAITISNDGDGDVTIDSISDVLDTGQECTVDATLPITLAEDESMSVGYTCLDTGSAVTENTVAVGFTGEDMQSATEEASAAVGFTVDETLDETSTVSDNRYGPLTLDGYGTASYALDIPANCMPFENIATVTGDDTGTYWSDSVTVTVCENTGGLTIGFWSNKNGQTAMKTLSPNLRGVVTKGELTPKFFTGATCDGDCRSMFRAQFAATALNVARTPALGSTEILVGSECRTVNGWLDAAAAYYPSLSSATKETTVYYKTIFDAINNNKAIVCPL